MGSIDIYNYVKQLIQKYDGIDTGIEMNNLEMNKDGFNNNIAMFHLTMLKSEEIFSKGVVLKDFSGVHKEDPENTKFTKEIVLLRSESIRKYIDIPKVYFVDEEKKIVLMEKIEGMTLDKLYLTKPEKMIWAFEKFGETLAYIHSIDMKTIEMYFSDKHLGKEEYYKSYINSLKNRMIEFEEPEYLHILESISERFKAVEFNESLNHGDYHFWNAILTNEDRLFVLDWEKARIADYRYDIANTLILGYSWFGVHFKKHMLAAYQHVIKKEIEHLDCFEALLSFDSFTKMIPLMQGGDDSHIRDKSFNWLKRRYELFVIHNGQRMKKVEDYLNAKGLSLLNT
ncbi:aminoglycoside phosphotransferase family protein [Bacillus rhizoplanae]|uniref:aminoglycoside phosphotransferase family protein n=1 Tax=Bacillus rhizoplanae TaxID=2880966 RepID=UPI003D209C82